MDGGTLPFLDTKITRKEDGKLDITVYRKQRRALCVLSFLRGQTATDGDKTSALLPSNDRWNGTKH